MEVLVVSKPDEVLADAFVDDILGGIQRMNYNQPLDQSGAIVSITSAMTVAVDKSEMFIPQETSTFSPRLISAAGAKIKCRTKVTRVEKRGSLSGYYIMSEDCSVEGKAKVCEEYFDRVFIATPLYAAAGLELNVPGIVSLEKEKTIKMKTVWSTFICGRLNGRYFGLLQQQIDEIRTIFIPSSVKNTFNSIGLQWRSSNTTNVGVAESIYKIFSNKEVPLSELERIFIPGYELLTN